MIRIDQPCSSRSPEPLNNASTEGPRIIAAPTLTFLMLLSSRNAPVKSAVGGTDRAADRHSNNPFRNSANFWEATGWLNLIREEGK